MTSTRKSKKNYLDRGSILDTFLKKNHPDNIRKTMSKDNPNIILNNIDEIKEGIKENEESDNDNDIENDKNIQLILMMMMKTKMIMKIMGLIIDIVWEILNYLQCWIMGMKMMRN